VKIIKEIGIGTLPQCLMAYRASCNSSTGISANKMVYGREIILPIQAFTVKPPSDEPTPQVPESYVSNLQSV
jgi:hypothetical protein